MLSFLIQAICIAIAAALAQGHAVSNRKISDTSNFSSGNKRKPAEWVPQSLVQTWCPPPTSTT